MRLFILNNRMSTDNNNSQKMQTTDNKMVISGSFMLDSEYNAIIRENSQLKDRINILEDNIKQIYNTQPNVDTKKIVYQHDENRELKSRITILGATVENLIMMVSDQHSKSKKQNMEIVNQAAIILNIQFKMDELDQVKLIGKLRLAFQDLNVKYNLDRKPRQISSNSSVNYYFIDSDSELITFCKLKILHEHIKTLGNPKSAKYNRADIAIGKGIISTMNAFAINTNANNYNIYNAKDIEDCENFFLY